MPKKSSPQSVILVLYGGCIKQSTLRLVVCVFSKLLKLRKNTFLQPKHESLGFKLL